MPILAGLPPRRTGTIVRTTPGGAYVAAGKPKPR